MTNTVDFSGTIIAGPLGAGDCCGSAAVYSVPFSCAKSAAAMMSGAPIIQSPLSFVTLPGVGVGGLVKQCTFLFLKPQQKMLVRLTMVGDSGDIVSTLVISGIQVLQFETTNYLKLIEAQGSGVIEFLATGDA